MTDPQNPYGQNAAPQYQGTPQYQAPPQYGAAPQYAPPGYAPAYPVAAPYNGLAITSLIAGIAAWLIFPVIGSIVAIITGHMALGRLKTSGEQGRGMAVAGLWLGYVSIALGVLAVILFLVIFLPLMGLAIAQSS